MPDYRMLVIPGEPAAWRAPKIIWPKGSPRPIQSKHKKHGYWQNRVALAAEEAGWFPLKGPVWVAMFFFRKRPGRLYRKKDPEGVVWCCTTPDYGNFAKSTEDGAKGLLYDDDRQIVCAFHMKGYHEKEGKPRAVIFAGECTGFENPIPIDECIEKALETGVPCMTNSETI